MKTTSKERPILFSAPMVCGILEDRKSMTRRAAKLTDDGRVKAAGSSRNWHIDDPNAVKACPYGQPGDRLWVRETWGIYDESGIEFDYPDGIPKSCPPGFHASYPADDETGIIGDVFRWRPSIHMPRWASRITLEIVSVGIERLREISEDDAIAEGIIQLPGMRPYGWTHVARPNLDDGPLQTFDCPEDAFRSLWESINGAGAWVANPYVWVVGFRLAEEVVA